MTLAERRCCSEVYGDEKVWRVGNAVIYKVSGGIDPDSLRVGFDSEGLPVVEAQLRNGDGKIRLKHYVNLEENRIESAAILDYSLFEDAAEYVADPEAVWRVQTGTRGERVLDKLTNNRREVGIWKVVEEA